MYIDRVERKPTVIKTVLVIGSVTADQYKDASLSVLENGHKPKIIRTTFEEFFLGSQQLHEKIATTEEAAKEDRRAKQDPGAGNETLTEASIQLLHELAVRHYSTFGDIGVFVVDQETWSKWDSSSYSSVTWMDHARMMQTDYAPRWVAYDSGKVEYMG